MNIPDRYHVKEYFVFRKLAMTPALLEYSGYPEYLENSHSWQQNKYSEYFDKEEDIQAAI